MRTIFRLAIALLLLVGLSLYAFWTEQRPQMHYLSDLRVQVAVNQGEPGPRGNLLGIQPQLLANDYQSIARLHRKLATYLDKARSDGLLNARTVVVLPEYIGTWLLVVGEKPEVYEAPDFDEAMDWLAASNPLDFAKALVSVRGHRRVAEARLRLKAADMARDYQSLFGGLAKEFAVTLVAGSIVLPEPSVENGQLVVGSGALFNISLVFASDGSPIGQPQRQLQPDPDYQPWAHTRAGNSLQVVDTPAGRLGILIGRDSWNAENYRQLDRQQTELIAVPAFIPGAGRWDRVHEDHGHPLAPAATPADGLSEGERWRQSNLAGLAPTSSARGAISVFSRGQLWDIHSDGHSFVIGAGQISSDSLPGAEKPGRAGRGGALFNLWL